MASRPATRPQGVPHGFMQHHREGMAGSPALPTPRSPSLKRDHHNRRVDDAGRASHCVDHETASTPFVLALRAPGAACFTHAAAPGRGARKTAGRRLEESLRPAG